MNRVPARRVHLATQARLRPRPGGDGARAHHGCRACASRAGASAPGRPRRLRPRCQSPPGRVAGVSVGAGVGVGFSVGGGTQTGPGGRVAEGSTPAPLGGPTAVPASGTGLGELIPPATGTSEGTAGEANDPPRSAPGVARSGDSPCAGVTEGTVRPDPSRVGASTAGEAAEDPSAGAPGRPGKAPNVATAIAATITHAPAAAIPTRPARRPGPARRLAVAVAEAGAGVATREACTSAILAPPAAEPAATAVPARRGVSASRNGAHLRQAASTRFQQSEQHVTPQPGHAWSEMCADANESLSRPQRSQNWAPRSTSHSSLARPLRTHPHLTVAAARRRGARCSYRTRRAIVPFGAGRHQGARAP